MQSTTYLTVHYLYLWLVNISHAAEAWAITICNYNWKVSGFPFAYPDSVVVSIQVWHTKWSGSIPDGSNLNYGLDHPQMISRKTTYNLLQYQWNKQYTHFPYLFVLKLHCMSSCARAILVSVLCTLWQVLFPWDWNPYSQMIFPKSCKLSTRAVHENDFLALVDGVEILVALGYQKAKGEEI